MSYRDQMLTCHHCGKAFVFTVEEQREQEALGFEISPPTRCPVCRKEQPPEPGLHMGITKWYKEDKGYGFIIQIDGSDIFFHRSSITGDVEAVTRERAPVWYEIAMTERGPQAINVHER